MEKHQLYAILIFIVIALFLILSNGLDKALEKIFFIGISLIGILFYRVIAWLARVGFIERFAKDYNSANHPGPYAFLFWCLFIAACGIVVFN